MSKPNLDVLQKELNELKERQTRVEGYADEYESALISGNHDPRLVTALRGSLDSLSSISFERGKVEARIEFARENEQQLAQEPEERLLVDDNWYSHGANLEQPIKKEQAEAEKERVYAGTEEEWWQDPQEHAAAEQKYQDWVKSRDDPNHVDDLDEPTPTRPR